MSQGAQESLSDKELDRPLIEDRLIREDEKGLITYTKRGLTQFIKELSNYPDYDLLYNQKGLVLHCRKIGTPLNNKIYLGKAVYTISKTSFKEGATIELMARLMYNIEDRMKWDTSLKVLKKLEGGDDAYVIRSWMHSPMFLVAEREVVDKRFEFYFDGVYYNISTSVNEDV